MVSSTENPASRLPARGITRRDLLKGTAAGGLAASGLASVGKALGQGLGPVGQDGAQPNLVFVFSDQQSWDMLGCYGNSQIVTPNLDRFAGQGTRFTHCFANQPVCTPYRGMLMTGKHALHNGCFSNDVPLLPQAGPFFGEVLRDAGYDTAYVGKWHLLGGKRDRPIPRGPMRYGFDSPTFYTDNCTTQYHPDHTFFWNEHDQKEKYGEWQPYGQTRQALDFIEQQDADNPFALFLSWHPPHDNGKRDGYYLYDLYGRQPELEELYDGVDLKIRANVPDQSERRKQQLRDHMAMCSGVDVAFGRLMGALEEKGVADNTIVVFTADHGDILGAYDWTIPKQIIHDVSSRVPLLVRQPGGVDAGRVSDLLISGIDLMPTLLSMMGLPSPAGMHGQDLADAIASHDDDAVESIPMWMTMRPLDYRGVITRDYTFCTQRDGPEHQLSNVLYDRRADPDQLDNRFHDDSVRPLRAHLERMTRRHMERFDDPFITFDELLQIRPIRQWQYPPQGDDPRAWSLPIDVIHGRTT